MMANMYKSLSLHGKHVASLKLTNSWPSFILTPYVVTAANTCPVLHYWVGYDHNSFVLVFVTSSYQNAFTSSSTLLYNLLLVTMTWGVSPHKSSCLANYRLLHVSV